MSDIAEQDRDQSRSVSQDGQVSGAFLELGGERYYVIRNVDQLAPFLISVISDVDHWLFVSSNGGLAAGRVSPATSLFPYVTVDKIHDSATHTGCKTIVRIATNPLPTVWEPFNSEHDGHFATSRNLYKNILGNKLCFEEINHDLQLAFRYTWATSDDYGFVRQCELRNLAERTTRLDLVDGFRNILPAGTPLVAQTNTSNLVNAYKWSELDAETGLAVLTLYAGITDRAEPCESLMATTVFSLGLQQHKVLLSTEQLTRFRAGLDVEQEVHRRGIRGAYFVNQSMELSPGDARHWQLVANTEQTQAEVVELRGHLRDSGAVTKAIARSIDSGSLALSRIMGRGDAYQATADENVSVHHYANVLFNILRGGIFDDQYTVSTKDFRSTVRHFNQAVYRRNEALLQSLPDEVRIADLWSLIKDHDISQLLRLAYEYLPITFGRRHGDPSRPWNEFAIKLKDEHGDRLLSYQGNWRDIFQNWEALLFSYPEFAESVIAKFVNASTMDGYNPYRITKEGIDWEVEEPDNPWSYIGYWGDHQIIYLQKLLELSRDFHPGRLQRLLRQPIFSYANVPYRIAPFEAQLANPKSTVAFDEALAEKIHDRVEAMGADGKLVSCTSSGEVHQVNLLEKLLVPLLCKLGNFVVDGGIWLNTQRPEWNDANNAIVGHGLSMVTAYYMRRYVRFLQGLLAEETAPFPVSTEVSRWFTDTADALRKIRPLFSGKPISDHQRFETLEALGQAASRYRQTVYQQDGFSDTADLTTEQITALLGDALATIDQTIATNQRSDGLYHAYNLLDLSDGAAAVDRLYPMLEGQVAALSSGAMGPKSAVAVLEALFDSDLYRPDQHSFMLYPDRQLPGFLEKNRIPERSLDALPLLQRMLASGDERILLRDADGCCRFNANFKNAADLGIRIRELIPEYGDELESIAQSLHELYETVFRHKQFTGRSGTMFGFEGLGCIYWHMVSKLMLAAQENFFAAAGRDADDGARRPLAQLYYRVRRGIGFNKTPAEYGAFPTDPYSHTPRHAGAKQPGMTGQVKEEILCRFGELGVRVYDGRVAFNPALLCATEFSDEPRQFRFLDIDDEWQMITVPANALAFTWCQVPIIYQLDDEMEPSVRLDLQGDEELRLHQLALPAEESQALFERNGRIRRLTVTFGTKSLFVESSDQG
ncbi:MAG: hypothetical protein JSV45_01155 [Chromatiales bacterium]|nr:MAG: hypothetical protein JSV45_01155 [Chromatiales bacterium]